MEDISEKKPLKRKAPASGAERNRKYRKKLKDDPKKAEEAKKKDRERKKKKREKDREDAKNDPELQEQMKQKKRVEMQNYRKKKKEQKQEQEQEESVQNKRGSTGKKTQAKVKRKKSKKSYRENKKMEKTKKQNALIRTQRWRMKIKLKAMSSTESTESSSVEDTETGDINMQIFANRMAENRALRRAKQNLPALWLLVNGLNGTCAKPLPMQLCYRQVIDTCMDDDNKQLVNVSFMESKHGNLYIWPSSPDTSWEPSDNIVETISDPVLSKESTNDRQLFFFK